MRRHDLRPTAPIRRLLVALATAGLSMSLVAAGDASVTVIGTDVCSVGADATEGVSPDAEDLCDVSWEVLAAGDDGPATVAITLRAAGATEGRLPTVLYGTSWTVAGCEISVVHRAGGTPLDIRPSDELTAVCDGAEYACEEETVVGTRGACEWQGGEFHQLTIAPPTFAGDTVRWELSFDGDLAVLADRHTFGTVVDPGPGFAAHDYSISTGAVGGLPVVTTSISPWAPGVCEFTGDGARDCQNALGDLVADDAEVRVTLQR